MEKIDQIILKYLEDSASEGEMQFLLNWMSQNEANKQHFQDCRDLWITTHDIYSENNSEFMAFDRFRGNVIKYEIEKQRKAIRLKYLQYAAVIALFITSSVGMYFLGNRANDRETPDMIVMNKAIVRKEKTSIVLPDGTKVWLNDRSKISYPDQFDGNERLVKLEGEGFFDVAHNESVPFYVETADLTVKALGTEFSVRSYPEEWMTATVLLSGKVSVNIKAASNKSVVLFPNQKVYVNKKTGAYEVNSVDAWEDTLWKNNKLTMENEELGTIIKKLERWYDVEIFSDKNVSLQSKFSITITDEPKEEIFRLLSVIAPIKYRIENNKITLSKK